MGLTQDDLARLSTGKSSPTTLEGDERGESANVDPEKGVAGPGTASDQAIPSQTGNGAVEGTKDPFLVRWEDNDKNNPQNWSMARKWFLVAFLSWITLLT